jgi:thymidylate synthase ThyX
MKAEIINCTQDALELLVYTKSGRLEEGASYMDVVKMPKEEKMDHLSYMMDTIKGAFEFIHYAFDISDVSRAFTHQLVRTRTASFQQQSQRTVKLENPSYTMTTDHPSFENAALYSFDQYSKMMEDGVPAQDARGILPTNVHTKILVSVNLRTLSDMASLRLCKRTQGEYQDVFKAMVKEVLAIHPWAEPLLKPHCVKLGVCAFPRYTKCPVQKFTLKLTEKQQVALEDAWATTIHEAVPVVKNGVTM